MMKIIRNRVNQKVGRDIVDLRTDKCRLSISTEFLFGFNKSKLNHGGIYSAEAIADALAHVLGKKENSKEPS